MAISRLFNHNKADNIFYQLVLGKENSAKEKLIVLSITIPHHRYQDDIITA
jgi:hypothetical protein